VEGEVNKRTFVDNLLFEIRDSLFREASSLWSKQMDDQPISVCGLAVHSRETELYNTDKGSEHIDISHVKGIQSSFIESAMPALQKSEAHRLLQRDVVLLNSEQSGAFVHKYVENSVTDHWNGGK
jgi:hypothetical protein